MTVSSQDDVIDLSAFVAEVGDAIAGPSEDGRAALLRLAADRAHHPWGAATLVACAGRDVEAAVVAYRRFREASRPLWAEMVSSVARNGSLTAAELDARFGRPLRPQREPDASVEARVTVRVALIGPEGTYSFELTRRLQLRLPQVAMTFVPVEALVGDNGEPLDAAQLAALFGEADLPWAATAVWVVDGGIPHIERVLALAQACDVEVVLAARGPRGSMPDDLDAVVSGMSEQGLRRQLRRARELSPQPVPERSWLRRAMLWSARLADPGAAVVAAAVNDELGGAISPSTARGLVEGAFDVGLVDLALGLVEALRNRLGPVDRVVLRARALFDQARFEDLVEFQTEGIAEAAALVDEARAALALEAMARSSSRRPVAAAFSPSKVVCFLHASVPFQSGGYAVRAQGLLNALSESVDVVGYTRPGFPVDLGKKHADVSLPSTTTHEGVRYEHLSSEVRRQDGEMAYMLRSIEDYEQALASEQPDLVHLRSTYVVALPGLIAAHRAGLPALYEVSGLWELVFEGRRLQPGQEGRRRRTERLERVVVQHVDAAVTMTEEMRRILVERGLPRERVLLAPNAVADAAFQDRPADAHIRAELGFPDDVPVIGYVGSFVDYEGLDVLVSALGSLRDRGCNFRAVLVGDGAERPHVLASVEAFGLGKLCVLPGRVPHEVAESYYSIIDICAYPRLSTPATRAVSPLKPFEAMATAKAVVVSDVPALAEIVDHGRCGVVVQSGSVEGLADALADLVSDVDRRSELGALARDHVATTNRWSSVASQILAGYSLAASVEAQG